MRFLVLFEELGVSVWAPYDRDATIHLGKNGNDATRWSDMRSFFSSPRRWFLGGLQATKGLGLGV